MAEKSPSRLKKHPFLLLLVIVIAVNSVILAVSYFRWNDSGAEGMIHVSQNCKPVRLTLNQVKDIQYKYTIEERLKIVEKLFDGSQLFVSPTNGFFATQISAYQHKVKGLSGSVGAFNRPYQTFYDALLEKEQMFLMKGVPSSLTKLDTSRSKLDELRRIVREFSAHDENLASAESKFGTDAETIEKAQSPIPFRILFVDGMFSTNNVLLSLELACCSLGEGGVFVLSNAFEPEVISAIQESRNGSLCPNLVPFFYLDNRLWFTTAAFQQDYKNFAVETFEGIAIQDAQLGAQLHYDSIPFFSYGPSRMNMERRDYSRIRSRWVDYIIGRDWKEQPVYEQDLKFARGQNTPRWVSPNFEDNSKIAKARKSLSKECDLYKGKWVYDTSYPLWTRLSDGSLVDRRCAFPLRNDTHFLRMRWQPNYCRMPRFNARHFLKRMKGKRAAFIGDAIANLQFQSMAGILLEASNTSSVRKEEAAVQNGSSPGSKQVFFFSSHNFSLEYYESNILIDLEDLPEGKSQLLLDTLSPSWALPASGADIIFTTMGHQFPVKFDPHLPPVIGGQVYGEDFNWSLGFEATLRAWGEWASVQKKGGSHVFFGGYSPWLPMYGNRPCPSVIPAFKGSLAPPPPFLEVTRAVQADSKEAFVLLDISELSSIRNDAFVGSAFTGSARDIPDCRHWCTPGVPDIWNELMYAELLRRVFN